MKRRDFGILTGSTVLTTATAHSAPAQTTYNPDPALLTTTLTPLGAERAGNADGSIPAWTGGLVSAPLPASQPIGGPIFSDEQPLYIVDSSNMAQHQDLLTPGIQTLITKYGFSLKVYPTHRTAAATQFCYDNTAKNVTRAKLDPRGGRLGFTDAWGGIPFPIINTTDPLVGGAQLIWNHLVTWYPYEIVTNLAPGCVVIAGKVVLVAGGSSHQICPYYDPNGSLETYDGYFSKGHYYNKAPASVNGQETLVWHSSNVNIHPDIVWSLVNGEGRVRKAPNEQFDSPDPDANGINNVDEASCFYGNPSQYDWTFIEKKEMLVPYNCNNILAHDVFEFLGPHFPNPDFVRWEKHRVWVVDATLHPGERNVNAKRRLYFDEDTWLGMLGEGYDAQGNMVKVYKNYNECFPSIPGTIQQSTLTFNLITGDYVYNGNNPYPGYTAARYIMPLAPSDFVPEAMAANASF
jgi:hypothetical protein